MDALNHLANYLNAHPEDLVAITSLLSVGVVYGINRVRELSKLSNALLGILAVPGVLTAGAAYLTSLHITAIPAVAVSSQLVYHIYEAIKRNAVSSVAPAATPGPTIVPVSSTEY